MYGVSYIQCKGPTGGLPLAVVYLPDGIVKFSIYGFQGQNGKTAFMSSRGGAVGQSLAVVGDGDESCSFTVENY